MDKNNKHIEHFLKFILFSTIAGIIQAIAFVILFELIGLVYWISYVFGLLLMIIFNFTLNRKYTFKSNVNVSVAMTKLIAFYIVFVPVSTWWGNELTILEWNPYIILFGTMFLNLILGFSYNKLYIYRNQIDTAK